MEAHLGKLAATSSHMAGEALKKAIAEAVDRRRTALLTEGTVFGHRAGLT
ncbi:hypothetical protein ABZU32_13030 [Sphaerisporangium sp. NPDC005288]